MRALADVARGLGLGDHVLLGRGEEATGGRDKSSILADTLEAVLGAVYLDAGLDAARDARPPAAGGPDVRRRRDLGAGLDWKTSLQELTSVLGLGVPEYTVDDRGPGPRQDLPRHRPRRRRRPAGDGDGRSKKEAEQAAAAAAWTHLDATRHPAAAGPA